MGYLKKIKQYFKWLFLRSWFFSIPIYIFLIPLLLPETYLEYFLSFSGLILQVVGVCMLIYGLDQKLLQFTEGGIKGLFIKWAKSRPRNQKISGFGGITETGESLHIRGKVHSNFENSTNEEKINYLLNSVERLEGKISDMDEKIVKEKKIIESKIEKLDQNLNNKIDEAKKDMSQAFLGNVKKEFFGSVSIIIGLCFASLTKELVNIYTLAF